MSENKTVGQIIDESMSQEEFIDSIEAGIGMIASFEDVADEVNEAFLIVRGISELHYLLTLARRADDPNPAPIMHMT